MLASFDFFGHKILIWNKLFYPKNQLSLWFYLNNGINILTAESKTYDLFYMTLV